jgi:uncharacterized protein YacL
MIFVLGLIVGLLIATLVFTILAFFRAGIEKRVKIIETVLASAGPKVKGAIYMPESEEDEARREHIEKNKAMGKDTPFEELM